MSHSSRPRSPSHSETRPLSLVTPPRQTQSRASGQTEYYTYSRELVTWEFRSALARSDNTASAWKCRTTLARSDDTALNFQSAILSTNFAVFQPGIHIGISSIQLCGKAPLLWSKYCASTCTELSTVSLSKLHLPSSIPSAGHSYFT